MGNTDIFFHIGSGFFTSAPCGSAALVLTGGAGCHREAGRVPEAVEPGGAEDARRHALLVREAARRTGQRAVGGGRAGVAEGADTPHPGEVRLGGAGAGRVGQGCVARTGVTPVDARLAEIACNGEKTASIFYRREEKYQNII